MAGAPGGFTGAPAHACAAGVGSAGSCSAAPARAVPVAGTGKVRAAASCRASRHLRRDVHGRPACTRAPRPSGLGAGPGLGARTALCLQPARSCRLPPGPLPVAAGGMGMGGWTAGAGGGGAGMGGAGIGAGGRVRCDLRRGAAAAASLRGGVGIGGRGRVRVRAPRRRVPAALPHAARHGRAAAVLERPLRARPALD